jgi:hypothetical protein
MIWTRKNISDVELGQLKERYDQLSTNLGVPFDMLMVRVPDNAKECTKVYMTLPTEDHLAMFSGFDIVPERALPREASLHFGNLEAFKEWFSLPEESEAIH